LRFYSSPLGVLCAVSLALASDTTPVSQKAPKEPKTYRITVPGLLQISLASDKTEFRPGEPIVVTKLLTNISDIPQPVDVASLSEGFSLQRIDPSVVCGVLADHAPGYQASVVQVAKGAALTSTYDLTSHPCFRGVGLYQATGSYCHYDPTVATHGAGSPSWCLQSESVTIAVVEK